MSEDPGPEVGSRLLDEADLVLDLCTPPGDAMVHIPGLDTPVGPGSTVEQRGDRQRHQGPRGAAAHGARRDAAGHHPGIRGGRRAVPRAVRRGLRRACPAHRTRHRQALARRQRGGATRRRRGFCDQVIIARRYVPDGCRGQRRSLGTWIVQHARCWRVSGSPSWRQRSPAPSPLNRRVPAGLPAARTRSASRTRSRATAGARRWSAP